MNVVALCGSPRRDGNSRLLAEAVLAGAAEAGHETTLVHLADCITGLLRGCRDCRLADGTCAIADGYRRLLLDTVLPADALVLATPLWWYGMSGYLKTFLDRLFCYVGTSSPECLAVGGALAGKRVALVLSAEESYPGAVLGVIHQIQEVCRYLEQSFVGYVVGIGNVRGEVVLDPSRSIDAAHDLGLRLDTARSTDYHLTTARSNAVWSHPDVVQSGANLKETQ